MIDGKKVLAIIPVRLGSKRLKMKNIKNFRGKPLFIWALMSAKKQRLPHAIVANTIKGKGFSFAENNNAWHHVVATYDGKTIKQYIDGKFDTSKDFKNDIASQDIEFRVGQAQTGLPSMFGKIDEVAVYDRALDLDEIKSDMENGVFFAVDPKGKLATTWAHLKR